MPDAAQPARQTEPVQAAQRSEPDPSGRPVQTGQPAQATRATAPPVVLFLCVHNAGRSQMAAAWLDRLAAGRVEVLSGGSAPGQALNPRAVAVMAERGIDLRRRRPRAWTPADLARADVVVTMGCGDQCPYVPGKRYEDWPVADPADAELEAVRAIRDAIEQRVRGLLASLEQEGATEPSPAAPT